MNGVAWFFTGFFAAFVFSALVLWAICSMAMTPSRKVLVPNPFPTNDGGVRQDVPAEIAS